MSVVEVEVERIESDSEYDKRRWAELRPQDRARIASAVETASNQPVYRKVKVRDLLVDENYQRATTSNRVWDIVLNFDWFLFNALWVANRRRSGKLYVVDGRHRLRAAYILGIEEVWCEIHATTGSKQEAKIFLQLTTKRRKMTSAQAFQAKLVMEDPQAQDIQRIVSKHKFVLIDAALYRGTIYRENVISAVGTLEHIYEMSGRRALDNVLYTLRAAWDGVPATLTVWSLRATWMIYQRHPDADPDKVARKLGEKDPWGLIERGQRFGHENEISQSQAVADVFEKVAEL